MKRMICALAAICLFMTSCGESKGKNAENKSESIYVSFDCSDSFSDSGEVYVSESSILTFIDRQSGIEMPLCAKPDCKHEGVSSANPHPSCDAYVEGYCSCPAIYNDKLYFLYTPEGKSGDYSPFFTKVLCCADKDGTNRREIARLEGAQTVSSAAYGDSLFACAFYKDFDKNGESLEKRECFAVVIDLENGNVYKSNTYTGYNGIIRNICIDGESIYFSYTYTTEKELINDDEYIKSTIRTEIVGYDYKNKNAKTLLAINGDCADIGYGYALISEDKPYMFDIKSGSKTAIDSKGTPCMMTQRGALMYDDRYCLYNNSNEKTALDENVYSVIGVTDSFVYLWQSEGDKTFLCVMDKESFLSGKKCEIKKLREM